MADGTVKLIIEADGKQAVATVGELKEKIQETSNTGKQSKLKDMFTGFSQEGQKANNLLGTFRDKLSFGAIAGAASSAVQTLTGGIGGLISEAASASDAMDKFKSTMKFAGFNQGDIDKASKSVKKYADDTVYDLTDVANTTAQLAANGIKDYTGLTQAAGNLNAVAGGNKDTFKSVAMVLTQTAGAGKLTTENWNQLADAIPGASGMLQEEMRKNGAYTGNFREAMEKGEISADEFNQAISNLGMDSAAKEAATATTTFEGAIGSLQANIVSGIQKVIDSIGKERMTQIISDLSNGIVGAINVLVKALEFIGKHAEVFKALAIGIGIAVAAFKTLSIITNVVNVIKNFNTAISAGKGVVAAFNVVMGANPFVLIIGAVVALTAGLIYFFTQTETGRQILSTFFTWLKAAWTDISAFFTGVWTGIQQTFTSVVTAIGAWLTNAWTTITGTISSVWNGISSFFSGLWVGIQNIFSTTISGISSIVSAGFTAVASIISGVWNGISSFFSSIWGAITSVVTSAISGIQTTISSVFNAVSAVVSSIWNGIKNTISNTIEGARNIVSNVIGSIKGYFSSLSNIDLFSAGRAIIDGFLRGLRSAYENVKSFIGGIGSWIKSHKGPISYDKKLLIDNGGSIMWGLNKGLQDSFKGVQKTVSGMAGSLANRFQSAEDRIGVTQGNASQQIINNSNSTRTINNQPQITMNVNWSGKEDIRKTMQEMAWITNIDERGGMV